MTFDKKKNEIILILLFNLLLFFRIFGYAWVADDAFLSFRPVLNMMDGYGPVFNIGERVQVFTHPLWFFLLALGGALKTNLYFWAILLGLLFSAAFQFVLYKYFVRLKTTWVYLVILVGFSCSESFLSFQTSGLENSLTNFLLAVFFYIYLFRKTINAYLPKISFIAALILLNRLDQVFLVIVPMCHMVWETKITLKKTLSLVFLYAWPLYMWELFSLVYYGFLFPNTKYVKIGGRTLHEDVMQGLRYTAEFVQTEMHFVFLFCVLCGCLIGAVYRKKLKTEFVGLMLSVCFQAAYVIIIGGCFMRGRFFVSSIVILSITAISMLGRIHFRMLPALLSLIFICSGICANYFAFTESLFYSQFGMENERNHYKSKLALNLEPGDNYTGHWFIETKKDFFKSKAGTGYVHFKSNGQYAYFVSRDIELVDYYGLSDAFIARLPVLESWRTGHFKKDIPEEYKIERRERRRLQRWENSEYLELWRKIELITRSKKLFTSERFNAMLWVWKRYGM